MKVISSFAREEFIFHIYFLSFLALSNFLIQVNYDDFSDCADIRNFCSLFYDNYQHFVEIT